MSGKRKQRQSRFLGIRPCKGCKQTRFQHLRRTEREISVSEMQFVGAKVARFSDSASGGQSLGSCVGMKPEIEVWVQGDL